VEEFVRLRHGWGLAATHLHKRIGPHLARVCEIDSADNDRTIRQKVTSTVGRLVADFSLEDRLAVDMALGGAPGLQHPLLSHRVALLAQRLQCADRTARRYIDRAFERLAEEIAAVHDRERATGDDDPETGWYVRRIEALLRLDTEATELIEARTIVATRDNLDRIAIRISVPKSQQTTAAELDMEADIQQGAVLESKERQGEAHFRLLLRLARPLARDDAHTYTIKFRLPPGQPMHPHYALVPLVRCDSFQARVRFDSGRPPAAVWRLHHMPPRMLADQRTPGDRLQLDGAAEVMLEFDQLERGFGYGIAWTL